MWLCKVLTISIKAKLLNLIGLILLLFAANTNFPVEVRIGTMSSLF